MDADMKGRPESARAMARTRRCRIAWILILVVDAGLVAWGAMAAAFPDHPPGPGGTPILAAGYEGFTKGSWSDLATTAPKTAEHIGCSSGCMVCSTWPSG